MPAARGQHLFTRTKRFLMDWAREQGMAGMFSEATAAHPYSQRANVELGAHETGFLLGWIPASVSNDAAGGRPPRRQSAALFYTKLNDGHERPRLRARAPSRDRRPDAGALRAARRPCAEPPAGAELPERTELHVDDRHRPQPGADHGPGPGRRPRDRDRRRAPPPLPPRLPRRRLPRPAAGHPGHRPRRRPPRAAGRLLRRRLPQHRCDGDVLRMQSLHRARIKADDVSVASEHGRELLDYVLADLPWTERPRAGPRGRRGGRRPCA